MSKPSDRVVASKGMQQVRKPENKTRRNQDERQSSSEVDVNLCIKVSSARRRHWASEAKRNGITMTAVIVEALIEKFGEPRSRSRIR